MRRLLLDLLREPVFHFLVAGGLLFALASWLEEAPSSSDHSILVENSDVTLLATQWEAQYGDPPTNEQLDALVQDYVSDEILYREALTLGLDRDDPIIRRRLIQKLRFLTEGLSELSEPAESELEDFYRLNRERYTEPGRTSFQHVYLSRDQRGERARSDAAALVEALSTPTGKPAEEVDWRTLGDPFLLQREYADRDDRELQELFGKDFAVALARVPPGTWAGPLPSSYGWHAVRVHKRSTARTPSFAEVRDAVRADWATRRRLEANAALRENLEKKYAVTILTPSSPRQAGP